MTEKPPNILKTPGTCTHGNFPDLCEICISKKKNGKEVSQAMQQEIKKKEVVRSEIEKLDHFMRSEVFPAFGITEEDEARSRAEVFPEDAPDALREIRERSFENIRELMKTFFLYFQKKGKTPEDLLTALRVRLKSVRKNGFIGFNERAEDISELIRDGEIKPLFQLPPEHQRRSTTGKLYSRDAQMRLRVEAALGYKEREHPTYLALGSDRDRERGPAPHYGAFHFSFPLEKLRKRTICVVGDSLNRHGVPYSLRDKRFRRDDESVEVQTQRRQLTLDHGLFAKALLELDDEYEPKQGINVNFLKAINYVEVQVLGPVRLSDAEELVLSRQGAAAPSEIKILAEKFKSSTRLIEALKKLQSNLVFRIAGEPPKDIREYYDYRTYERFFKE